MNAENRCIGLSGVSKSVAGATADAPRLQIVEDISLEVKFGEAVVISGESGSGKTTLLGLMAGLDSADSGRIELLGERIDRMDEEQRAAVRRGQVGFVFQSFHLVRGADALQNVLLPMELAALPDAAERARDSLQRVGLSGRLETPVERLSGGEQQRVAIARAYALRPRILFADEPTGNLDRRTGEQIIDLMFALRDDTGAALVLVTHEQRLAERGDRQLWLEQGRFDG